MQLATLKTLMKDKGCRTIYIKQLAANDNKKQQVYFGGNFSAINLIPFKEIKPDSAKSHIFKASLDFFWLSDDGRLYNAPNAQLILYPQYPEVRFSGFLKGCMRAPSELMDEKLRLAGRILFLGICANGTIIGYICHPDSALAREIAAQKALPKKGVFEELGIDEHSPNNEETLLQELRRIHLQGWIRSKRLGGDGGLLPCEAPNCGGYTLEAELGIIPNGISEPDFLGFEVKQYNVTGLDRINTGILTLMTPEPTGGFYKTAGVESFIRKYGYPDMTGRSGREDRLNFGGIHRVGSYHERTGLAIVLKGFDMETGEIRDASGGVALMNLQGEEAAIWHYTEIMRHWNRKHAQAIYVPSICMKTPVLNYRYGNMVRLGLGTDFLLYLKALSTGNVYYDPGIKLENASTSPRTKRRSQFRIKSVDLPGLYHEMKTINLSQP